ncbi:hypothetical protein L218DRAFT_967750 [Marasmius fiardii PR-910]|nr:hypothetical protein L218DRAFT_967746 [Marasmius fiardii PR-910]KAF9254936.1 hypothetical protein L218DRAFT_967750 [Marasmius fiardii PR-910]
MPGIPKHVRFSTTRTEYTIRSPSYSLSPLPSSDGRAYYGSASPPVKAVAQPVRAHSLLSYSSSHQPALNFDVTLPITAMTAKYRSLPSQHLSEPATSPTLPSLILTCRLLPRWTITIYSSNGRYVTVRDVLDGIYKTLRKNVTHKEYHSIPTQRDQHRINKAYERRYSRVLHYHAEKQSGVKRVDFLCERVWFTGIAPTNRADVWELRLESH